MIPEWLAFVVVATILILTTPMKAYVGKREVKE